MIKTKKIIPAISFLLLLLVIVHVLYLTTLNANETYLNDTFLDNEKNKTALIIVAHDDDAISAAGTISKMCASGWTVKELCFYRGYENKDSIRKLSLLKAGKIEGLKEIKTIDFDYRNDTDTNSEPWMPLPYKQFTAVFKVDSMEHVIADFIERNKPSVIFTLDDVIGGYGHPEHVLVSRILFSYCKKNIASDSFTIKRIYQPVFSPSQAESILGKNITYTTGKKVYNCLGMPLPDVQINIAAYGNQKKDVMIGYTTEQHSLKTIWPYYTYYPSSIYFRIFDREFFRIISIDK
jgi:LmbE family N-acetylglucosaminyl deacetylase